MIVTVFFFFLCNFVVSTFRNKIFQVHDSLVSKEGECVVMICQVSKLNRTSTLHFDYFKGKEERSYIHTHDMYVCVP